jgi:hypothetical protein
MKISPLIIYPLSLAFALLATAQTLPTHTVINLNHLQGHWEGEGAGGKCSITITNNTLLYRVGTNWHKTTFTLPAGTNPQQLHATIIDVFPPAKDSIGQVVPAIIKIEHDTLTLAAYSLSQDPPKSFEEATTKYVVTKVQPQKVEAVKPKAK